jgi:HK97 family phage prohead protease
MILFKNSAFALDEKAVSDTGVIEGYASVFGVVDSYGEVVEPGAFVDSLVKSQRTGRRIKMLYQHDPHQVLGVWDDLAEDSKGLYVKGRLLIDKSPKAAEVHGLLQERALDGLSIGYRTIEAKPKEGKPGVLSLLKLDLFENSIVTFAANERARVETVKSILEAGKLPTVREFEGALRELGLSKAKAAAIATAATPHLRGEPEGQAIDDMRRFLTTLRA